MKHHFFFGSCALISFCMSNIVVADVKVATLTKVYFSNNGNAYKGHVDYEVQCYGYTTHEFGVIKKPGTYTPDVVYSYSASCPEYGCTIYEPYYLNYRHIDYCNLTADTDDGRFVVEKYAKTPRPKCENLHQCDMVRGKECYQYREKTAQCDAGGTLECNKKHLVRIPDLDLLVDDQGYLIERSCKWYIDFARDNHKVE
jgi:hypothetical protein